MKASDQELLVSILGKKKTMYLLSHHHLQCECSTSPENTEGIQMESISKEMRIFIFSNNTIKNTRYLSHVSTKEATSS